MAGVYISKIAYMGTWQWIGEFAYMKKGNVADDNEQWMK